MFELPDPELDGGPWQVFKRVLAYPELVELKEMLDSEITVAIVMRSGDWRDGGRGILGMCFMPSVNGKLRPLFEFMLERWLGYFPDFLIMLNAEFWEAAPPAVREALMFHEASHAGHAKDAFGSPRFHRETGNPIPCIVPHDLEEFRTVVARYGAWSPDIASFLEAANGAQEPQRLLLSDAREVSAMNVTREREATPRPANRLGGDHG